ncbi:regulatory protein RecX [Marinicrinis sediminis]|uniref:Regulatory protein RecX n=1 Tax=Marinicrinis sediminis TaxID=1652465 RepID=A0ABW5R5K2_9BACL
MNDNLTGVISGIEPHQKNKHRYHIYIRGQYAFSVHEDIVVKYRLVQGREVDQTLYQLLCVEEERHLAYAKAVRFLGHRRRTEYEMRQKLENDGIERAHIEHAVKTLRQQGYLDDAQFARQFASDKLRLQKKGAKWIEYALKRKGIAEEMIQSAMNELPRNEEMEAAYKLAQKKWKQLDGKPLPERKQKTMGYVMRRGFPSSVTREVIDKLMTDEDHEER